MGAAQPTDQISQGGGALALIENEIEYERTWWPERTS